MANPDLLQIDLPPGWRTSFHHLTTLDPSRLDAGVPDWQCFDEDLLLLQNEDDSVALDVGWYPTEDPQGRYRLVVVEGDAWDTPVVTWSGRSLAQLHQRIQEELTHLGQRHPPLPIERLVERLTHPSPAVRSSAAERLVARGAWEALPSIERAVEAERDMVARARLHDARLDLARQARAARRLAPAPSPKDVPTRARPATLYASPPPRRFFHIPDEVTPPPGPTALGTLAGETVLVDLAGCAAWEISEEQAQAIARGRVEAVSRGVRAALAGARRVAAGVHAAQQGVPGAPAPDPVPVGIVAAALGVSPEALGKDPEEILARLKANFADLGATLGDMVRDDPASREQIRARLQILAAALEAEGLLEPDQDLQGLPEALRGFLANPDLLAQLDQATARLRVETERMRREREPR